MASKIKSQLEEMFELQIKLYALPKPVREHRFHPNRRWRIDFCWPDVKLGVEIHGGEWARGRHVRPKGFINDCEKMSHAILEGWAIMPLAGTQIKNGQGIQWVVQFFEKREQENARNNTGKDTKSLAIK